MSNNPRHAHSLCLPLRSNPHSTPNWELLWKFAPVKKVKHRTSETIFQEGITSHMGPLRGQAMGAIATSPSTTHTDKHSSAHIPAHTLTQKAHT